VFLIYYRAKQVGGYDVLYISCDGKILEGTTYNFFAVKKGKVYTSQEDILYGITRKFLLDVGK
jgi:branched-subunit amino acid aminotransferase/4-amino-4-deoxychorismate lyase